MKVGQKVKIVKIISDDDIYGKYLNKIGVIYKISTHDVYPYAVKFADGRSSPFSRKEIRPLRRTCFEKE